MRPTVKFVEMIVKKDEEVADDEEVITIDEITADISTANQEGDEDADIVIEDVKVVQEPVVVEKKPLPVKEGEKKTSVAKKPVEKRA